MGAYFKPWRRKIGTATLVMALSFMGLWIRSLTGYELLCMPKGRDRSIIIISAKSCIYIKTMHQIGLAHVFHYWIGARYSDRDDTTYLGKDVTRERRFLGFLISDSSSIKDKWTTRSVLVPYWSIVTPPTLLSAYLLLSKPGAAKPPESP